MEERAAAKTGRRERVCKGIRGVCMCVICCSVLGERLGVTLNATAGLLEVIIVDANSKLIVELV